MIVLHTCKSLLKYDKTEELIMNDMTHIMLINELKKLKELWKKAIKDVERNDSQRHKKAA